MSSTTSDQLSEVASALGWQTLQCHHAGKTTHWFARDKERIVVRYDSAGRITTAWFKHRYATSVIGKSARNKMSIVLDWLGAGNGTHGE